MKRKRTMIAAVIVLIALIAGIFVVNNVEKHVDSLNSIDEVIISLDGDDVSKFEWTIDGETLGFEKSDDTWIDPDDADFPVDTELITEFLDEFSEVHASFIIDDVEDYSQYGLEEPDASVTFTLSEGSLTVDLGSYSVMDEKRYVSIGDGKVYLIDTDLLEDVSVERDDFMLHDTLTDMTQVTEFKVTGELNTDLVYDEEGVYTYTDIYNYYMVENGNYLPVADDSAEEYMGNLLDLTFKTYASYTASNEDLSAYGLDSPALTITVNGYVTDEETKENTDVSETVYIGYVIDTETEVEEGEDPAKLVYLRVGDSEIIYSVSQTVYDTLIKGTYNDIRPSDLVYIDEETVTQVTAALEDIYYQIDYTVPEEEKDEEETAREYTLNDYSVSINGIISALNSCDVQDFEPENEKGTLEFSISVKLDREKYDSVEVSFYRYDGDYCLATVNDEEIGLVNRSEMTAVREAFMSVVLNLGKDSEEAETVTE